SSAPENNYRQISMQEAVSIMETEDNYIILDVRTKEEYQEKHIPGAVNIPNETIGTEEIPELPEKDQQILVYCRSGNRSKQAAKKLAALGYTNIIEFGGINDWTGDTVSGDIEQ
ncbi:MAG: rhodanese-like domain-containing protein, partial [Clostridium sp.]|nr:rhodanese-like domain-containing protein [Clostridium sp.]